MVNILFFSDNEDFKNDLILQIEHFAEDANVTTEAPDIIIVDEDKNKYLQERSKYPSIPMLLLTSAPQSDTDNLNLVIHKPFNLMKLIDVVRAANNKLDNSADGFLNFNDYELHPTSKEIADLRSGKIIKLTEKEVGIIKYLYKMRNEYVSKNDLQTNVWQYNENVTTHTVETHIYRLRQKVEHDTRRLIITDSGKYKLNTD